MPRFLLAAPAMLVLAACASSAVRYVDTSGREHAGTVDPMRNIVTADIGGKVYRGPLQVNEWGQVKSTLVAPGGEQLYCDFQYRVMKVNGTCTDLSGGDYTIQNR